ncbi:uncharacterized protein CPUR_04547, partial [Claviceps purpurea 20.1]
PGPPELIDGEPEWEVERILASRVFGRGDNRRLQYQVTWRGLEPDEMFYDAEGFKNAATTLESFHREYPDAAGPPARLQTWIREAADDVPSSSHPDDNRAEHDARGSLGPKKHKTRHK